MKLAWQRWLYGLWDSLLRHIGTAALTWGGLTAKHWNEVHSLWGDLGVALLCGAIVPTMANWFASHGAPELIEDGAEKKP